MEYIYQDKLDRASIQRVTKGILYLQDSRSIIPINLDDIVIVDMRLPNPVRYLVDLCVLVKRSRQINILCGIDCYDEVLSNMLKALNSRFYTVKYGPGEVWGSGFTFFNSSFDWSLGNPEPKKRYFFYVRISRKDISPFEMEVPSYVVNADFLNNVNNTKEILCKKK